MRLLTSHRGDNGDGGNPMPETSDLRRYYSECDEAAAAHIEVNEFDAHAESLAVFSFSHVAKRMILNTPTPLEVGLGDAGRQMSADAHGAGFGEKLPLSAPRRARSPSQSAQRESR